MTVRLRLEYTRYPHIASHSGYFQFAHQLDRQHFDVDIRGTPDTDAKIAWWVKPVERAVRPWLKRHAMPWYKANNLEADLRLLPQALAGQVDVVHFLDGEHSGSLAPRLIRSLRSAGVKTVATFHQPPSIAQTVINSQTLKWFDHLILVSPSQIDFFAQFVHRDRLHVLLHGVDTTFFHPATRVNRETRIRCITVGHWLRDVDALTRVISALVDDTGISFDVVTNRNVGLEGFPNVRVHRDLDDTGLAELYRAADVLFLPLVDGTANNALLEGIASGLAVVTTDIESTRTYLPNGEAIFVKDNQVGEFVEALREVRTDIKLRLESGRRARMRAEELAWSRIALQYEAFYLALV